MSMRLYEKRIVFTIQETSNASLHLMLCKPNDESSTHYHERKDQLFVVLRGKIEFYQNGFKRVLCKGDMIASSRGEWHRFFCLEESVVLEHYTGDDCDQEDIVRQCVIEDNGNALTCSVRYDSLLDEWRASYNDVIGRGSTEEAAIVALQNGLYYASGADRPARA